MAQEASSVGISMKINGQNAVCYEYVVSGMTVTRRDHRSVMNPARGVASRDIPAQI